MELLADFNYAEISSSSSGSVAYTRTGLTEFLGNFVVAWRMIDAPRTRLDLYVGARVISLKAELPNVQRFTDRRQAGPGPAPEPVSEVPGH